MTEWDALADWWSTEIDDPAYALDVQPLVDVSVAGLSGPTLDIGCGTGRLLESLPPPAFGCDSSSRLLSAAVAAGMPAIKARVPELAALRDGVFNCAVACLVLEHIADLDSFFAEVYRLVAPGGHLVVVSNHPAYTSSGAGPVVDMSDGEVLWRWGTYFYETIAVEPAGSGTIAFHHRPLAAILNAAAAPGWALDLMIEAGAGEETIARVPSLEGQEHMPRLLALRWQRPH